MTSKFRTSLSLEQVQWIMAKPDCPIELYKQLDLLVYKANAGLAKPAFSVKASKEKKEESLSIEQGYKIACKKLEQGQPLDERLQNAYNEYRYTNDLMTPEEEADYEQQTLGL